MLESSSSVALVLLIPMLIICPSTCKLDFRDREDLLESHNYYRSEEGATKMFMLEWDNRLAKIAQKHTKKCVDEDLNRDEFGENYLVSPRGIFFADAVVDDWLIEKLDYHFDNESCGSNWHYCENYLQVVWASTQRVGCAATLCPILDGEPESTFALCLYIPRGNVSGIQPFKKGIPCSECPPNYRCIRNLCASSKDIKGGSKEISSVNSVFLLMIFAVWYSA